MPATMSCVEIGEAGGPDVLRPAERPVPAPGPGEVRIRVQAAGINRPDVMQRQGLYPAPAGASDLPGLEVAGVVEALGPDTHRLAEGDAVCALLTGGGYAEYVVVAEPCCLPVPPPLSVTQAAALPETFFTVWHNVFERGALKPGEVFLVHGGTSGIGTTAIQMAAAFSARVFATAGDPDKVAFCERLGAEKAINYREADFTDALKTATDGHGADVILDMVGGDYIPCNLRTLATEGRLVNIAYLQGSKVEVDFLRVLLKRLTVTGSTLRVRSVADKAAIARHLEEKVWPIIEDGCIAPVVHTTFPLFEAADAHRLMESSGHKGKIVLTTEAGG